MTPEQQRKNRKLWIAALRGEIPNPLTGKPFEQGRALLESPGNKFCCLGVLAVLAECERQNVEEGYAFDKEIKTAPWRAMEFVGLASAIGSYSLTSLMSKNDTGATFAEIAKIIEAEPKGLFTT